MPRPRRSNSNSRSKPKKQPQERQQQTNLISQSRATALLCCLLTGALLGLMLTVLNAVNLLPPVVERLFTGIQGYIQTIAEVLAISWLGIVYLWNRVRRALVLRVSLVISLVIVALLTTSLIVAHSLNSTTTSNSGQTSRTTCPGNREGVTLYVNSNYHGQCYTFAPGQYDLAGSSFAGHVGSIKDPTGAYHVRITDQSNNPCNYDNDTSVVIGG